MNRAGIRVLQGKDEARREESNLFWLRDLLALDNILFGEQFQITDDQIPHFIILPFPALSTMHFLLNSQTQPWESINCSIVFVSQVEFSIDLSTRTNN